MRVLHRLYRLWWQGLLLALVVWFTQLLIAVPFLSITKERLDAWPRPVAIGVAVVFLAYAPLAFGWVFSSLLMRVGICRKVLASMLQQPDETSETDLQPIHIVPFVALGAFNLILAFVLSYMSKVSAAVFLVALAKPAQLPILTAFLMRINWWPGAVIVVCFISIILILAGRLRGRTQFKLFAVVCLSDGVLLIFSMVGFWSPLKHIIMKMLET